MASTTVAVFPTRAAVPVRSSAGSLMWRLATGRSPRKARLEMTRKTRPLATNPAPAAATTAATRAPTANGARKKPIVRTSPTAKTTAAMSQSTHSSMCGRSLPGSHHGDGNFEPGLPRDRRDPPSGLHRVLDPPAERLEVRRDEGDAPEALAALDVARDLEQARAEDEERLTPPLPRVARAAEVEPLAAEPLDRGVEGRR